MLLTDIIVNNNYTVLIKENYINLYFLIINL